MKDVKSYPIAVKCFLLCALVIVFCSCVSFDIGDWPSKFAYPHNSPAENWCGPTGAFCAYQLLYYIGPGVFVFLVVASCYLAARLLRIEISQVLLRVVGLLLLTVAASGSFYCFWPHSIYSFPTGSGGLVGVGAVEFLRGHFATLGTFLLLASIWLVGITLLADTAALYCFKWLSLGILRFAGLAVPVWSAARKHSEMLGRIARRLQVRQKSAERKPAIVQPITGRLKVDSSVRPGGKSEVVALRPQEQKKVKVRKSYVPESYEDYELPPLDLLAEPEFGYSAVQGKVVKAKAATLEQLLSEFNINARVVAADTGPVVTMFELELSAGVKVSQIGALSNDMARALGAGAVRVVAPLPGKHTIGIEVPNSEKEKVRMKDLLQLAGSRPERMEIPLFLGKDSAGEALVSDLTAMPHLLIAGTTGSGKSVCINSIIVGILLTRRPDEVKMILVDPKMVEMTAFNTVPHLMCPIVTETQRAAQILEWATQKMDERYALLAEARVKNIAEYNMLGPEGVIERFNPSSEEEAAKIPKKLPYIVIIIDELADMMMTAAKEIESFIVRLAQKSRAVGIHMVLATQRPQATVVTGLIKSNMPTRIGFRVAARMDSRIILDQNGAEALLGQGDMLFLKPGTSDLIRSQGTFVDDIEVKRIVRHLKEVAEPQFHPELQQLGRIDASHAAKDDMFDEAARIILETQRGSVSLLQRRLSVGYARASRIIEMMAASGILGEYKGSQAREVMMTLKEYEKIKQQMDADKRDGYSDMEDDEPEESSVSTTYLSEGQKEYVAVDAVDSDEG